MPKHTILSLVKRGLDSGDITTDELRQLLPKEESKARKAPKHIRDAVKQESERHQLARDGLRFAVQPRGAQGYHLSLLRRETNLTAGARLGELFNDTRDLPTAADRVIENYLKQLAE